VTVNYGAFIVNTGLVVCLDAINSRSYTGSGTTWYDLSGNSTDAILTNSPTYGSGSFTFNGTSQYASMTRTISDDFSLLCWFKTSSSAGSGSGQWWAGNGLVDGEVAGTANDFGLSIGAGKLLFGVGNTDTTIVSTSTYNDNIWHCVVATRVKSSGAMTLYVDGYSVATGTGQTGSLTGPTNITIGVLQTIVNYFTGSIGSVLIYNKALTGAEVLQNFNAYRGRYKV